MITMFVFIRKPFPNSGPKLNVRANEPNYFLIRVDTPPFIMTAPVCAFNTHFRYDPKAKRIIEIYIITQIKLFSTRIEMFIS